MLRKRRFRRSNELANSRPYHGCDHEPLCQTETLTAMRFVEQQGCVDESEYAVFIPVERKQLNLGFDAAVFQRDRAKAAG